MYEHNISLFLLYFLCCYIWTCATVLQIKDLKNESSYLPTEKPVIACLSQDISIADAVFFFDGEKIAPDEGGFNILDLSTATGYTFTTLQILSFTDEFSGDYYCMVDSTDHGNITSKTLTISSAGQVIVLYINHCMPHRFYFYFCHGAI